jgi:hypothetical protein
MADGDGSPIELSQSGLSAPDLIGASNTVEVDAVEASLDILPGEQGEFPPQFRGKLFRVIDDQLFIVDPGSPPAAPPR